jgi:two-component system phosphate regulon sensor histidine kinase PhoR
MKIRHKIVSLFIPRILREIDAWARSFAGGDFSRRISLSARDEMEELADPLNDMSERVQSKMEEFIADKSRLEAVFLSMFDGVMIIDHKGAILLMNQTLKEFLSVDQDVVGKKPLEVVRNIEIQEIADNVLNLNNRFESREITVLLEEEKTLLVHATPVFKENQIDGAVLVFHDITQLRQLEKVRKDFVANVSHELRTPVSTIQGYAETLLEGALEDKEHAREFLRIIHDDAGRLAQLIQDLLDLSQIESGKLSLTFESCALEPVVDKVLAGLKHQAQARSIHLTKKIPARLPKIRIDAMRISQVLFNLVDNAIKYNNAGGSVTVSARETDHGIEVSVVDTGIGIPPEDLPRIFERFYRVDKARSRELGGTGLGLSIVKHIIQAHQAEITVDSQPGHGSTFRFTLPKAL